MQRIVSLSLAQTAQRVPDRLGFDGAPTEPDLTVKTTHQNQSSTPLRNSEFLGVQNFKSALVTKLIKLFAQFLHALVGCQSGDILKHNGLGPNLSHKAQVFKDEIVALVSNSIRAVERLQCREALTWRASRQQIDLPFPLSDSPHHSPAV
jgi:hypothetical protein